MTKPLYVPVIDRKDIVRDTRNQALLSVDDQKLRAYKEKKQLFSGLYNQQKEIELLKYEVQTLKKQIEGLLRINTKEELL